MADYHDHSLNLTVEPDERDRGWGIRRAPDGTLVQGDGPDRTFDQDERESVTASN